MAPRQLKLDASPTRSFHSRVFGLPMSWNWEGSFPLGLLDILTLPQRARIAERQIAQQQVRLTTAVVDQVTQVRQAWVRAVAAQQSLGYASQVNDAAQASSELARRLYAAGNFSKLQRARQQAFYADAVTQLAAAQHASVSTREELARSAWADRQPGRSIGAARTSTGFAKNPAATGRGWSMGQPKQAGHPTGQVRVRGCCACYRD
jgi:outer membrane protein TolC